MLEKILIFIIFLGPLVFFHELGHFLFARLFGVRVEVFSIGFGPKLFKFKWGDTDYCVSAIPLGGYVKMFGDDPLNMGSIEPQDRQYSFTHKNKWARFWIVLGGPLANFILAYFLFASLFMAGEKVPELRVGMIPEQSVLYQSGLRPGDSFREFNGKQVLGPTDIALEGQKPVRSIVVSRNGELVEVSLPVTSDEFFEELIQYPATLRKPYLVDSHGQSYFITAEGSTPSIRKSLDQLSMLRGQQTFVIYSIPEVFSENNIENQRLVEKARVEIDVQNNSDLARELLSQGFAAKDTSIRSVLQGSAADKAQMKAEDVIVAINDQPIYSFDGLVSVLNNSTDEVFAVTYWRAGETIIVDVTPEVKMENGKERRLIGIYSNVEYIPFEFIQTESRGLASFYLAIGRTWDVTLKTIEGFRMLFTAQVSLKTIGGPIAIGQVASDSFNTSISYFFQLMALISINLGLINLLPIPVLDGGHILFIILEAINRGPISRRKMEIAQQLGLSLLLLLMVGAIFNDVSRLF
jgi:regulator of sigma E protease